MIPAPLGFDRVLQDGVRALAEQVGYTIEELPYAREKTHCCGYGGLTSYANPEVGTEIAVQCIGQSSRDYLTYCVNCRDQFLQQGKTDMAHFRVALWRRRKAGGRSQHAAHQPASFKL